MVVYNPWHGCHKFSEGCMHCYVFRMDEKYHKDTNVVTKNKTFNDLIKRKKDGSYTIGDHSLIYLCFSSDFFIEEADTWRNDVWKMIRERQDATFLVLTKRIHRFYECIPDDWGSDYNHVTIGCTVENQKRADERLPLYLSLPMAHKMIICEPLLEAIDLKEYLNSSIELLLVGGESGNQARLTDYDWIVSLSNQAQAKGVPFHFKQTGTNFRKDGKIYRIARKDQSSQAKKANLNTV